MSQEHISRRGRHRTGPRDRLSIFAQIEFHHKWIDYCQKCLDEEPDYFREWFNGF